MTLTQAIFISVQARIAGSLERRWDIVPGRAGTLVVYCLVTESEEGN